MRNCKPLCAYSDIPSRARATPCGRRRVRRRKLRSWRVLARQTDQGSRPRRVHTRKSSSRAPRCEVHSESHATLTRAPRCEVHSASRATLTRALGTWSRRQRRAQIREDVPRVRIRERSRYMLEDDGVAEPSAQDAQTRQSSRHRRAQRRRPEARGRGRHDDEFGV